MLGTVCPNSQLVALNVVVPQLSFISKAKGCIIVSTMILSLISKRFLPKITTTSLRVIPVQATEFNTIFFAESKNLKSIAIAVRKLIY